MLNSLRIMSIALDMYSLLLFSTSKSCDILLKTISVDIFHLRLEKYKSELRRSQEKTSLDYQTAFIIKKKKRMLTVETMCWTASKFCKNDSDNVKIAFICSTLTPLKIIEINQITNHSRFVHRKLLKNRTNPKKQVAKITFSAA